jgi:ABC-type glycerol-3-phosphate transport system permease component
MVFYLAAMQNIDKSIYEAARIDGISAFRRFVSITIPMLKPVILFTTVTSTIGTLQLFDEVMNITNGGPADSTLSLSLYIYNLSFRYVPNFGYAATVSYVIVALVASHGRGCSFTLPGSATDEHLARQTPRMVVYVFLGRHGPALGVPLRLDGDQRHQCQPRRHQGQDHLRQRLVRQLRQIRRRSIDVGQVFWNSAKIAIVGSLLTLAVSSIAGYGFECSARPSRERIYQGLLLSMMVPFAALMIPLFTLMASADMLDTHMAVILPTVASAYLIFYFRQSSKAFPSELREAARVDGLKEWQIFLCSSMCR